MPFPCSGSGHLDWAARVVRRTATSIGSFISACEHLAHMTPGQIKRTAAERARNMGLSYAGVRFGSLADICSAQADVRFTPKSGHVRCS